MFLRTIEKLRHRLAIERREWRRWSRCAASPSAERVFYGYDRLFEPQGVVSGGLVKLLDLLPLFPNCPDAPHLLYLISSALPPYAARMVWWARRRGARVVVNQNGVAYPAWHGPGWRQSNRVLRTVLRAADHVFYQSRFCKLAADRYLGPAAGTFEILHNPVDTAQFVPPAAGSPRPIRTLLLAGSHCHFYRVRCALETLAILRREHRDTTLILAGRNEWCADAHAAGRDVRELAQQLGVAEAVTCVGPYLQPEAVALFHRAGVLLHAKYNDPCPRLVVEALACGLPVVYSASGGVPELVGPDAGIGVPAPLDWETDCPPRPEALAEAVKLVWAGYATYATAARARAVHTLDVRPWRDRHAAVFTALLGRAAEGSR